MQETSERDIPLRAGRPDQFARVESALRAAGFDEGNICKTLHIQDMADLSRVKPLEIDFSDVPPPLTLFIRLFLFTESVPRPEVDGRLDPEVLDAMLALDLLRVGVYGVEKYYSPIFLYPVAGLLIASDRQNAPDGSEFTPPADVVFPAINVGTLLFLNVTPRSPAADVLDLGSGSGVAALALSRHVDRVVASDITARASHFAEFNRLLNGCENVEVVTGDLYEPVQGRTFDRIVSHPPYVPSLGDSVIYRDGGETGEALIRTIVRGLPRHLRRGGAFYAVCVGHDTVEGRFEERVRGWLGESQNEYDVVFARGDERSAQRFLSDIYLLTRGDGAVSVERLGRALEGAGTLRLVYGVLAIRRHLEDREEPWTARPELSRDVGGASFEWCFEWQRWKTRPDALDALRRARVLLAPHLLVKVTHKVQNGALVPEQFVLETGKPFPASTRVDPWLVPVIAEFDGRRTTAELYEAARAASAVPEVLSLEDFTKLVMVLADRGYLTAEEFPRPDEWRLRQTHE